MTDHSKVGASSCERFWNCPGCVQLIEAAPKQPQNPFGLRGSILHAVCEMWLREAFHADGYPQLLDAPFKVKVGGRLVEVELTDEEYDNVRMYVNFIQALVALEPCGESAIEKKFTLKINPNAFGTADFTHVIYGGTAYVVDYKSGVGKTVKADKNLQGLFYAIGATQDLDYDKLAIIIVQPLAKDGSPIKIGSRCFTSIEDAIEALGKAEDGLYMDARDVDLHAEELQVKIEEGLDPEVNRLRPGSWCKYCPAIDYNCTAQDKMLEIVKSKDLTDIDVNSLSAFLSMEGAIKERFKSANQMAIALINEGIKIPEYKLVLSKKNRKVADEVYAVEVLSQYVDPCDLQRLQTPTHIKKFLDKDGKKVLDSLMYVPDSNPATDLKLVHVTDTRDEYVPSNEVAQLFDADDEL